MEITEVKVFPINEEKLKAFVSVVFDRCFMVNDIKIIHGKQGLFISMPSRKKKNGEFKDVAHPLNNETRRMIEGQVLAEYDRVLVERGMKPEGEEARSQKAAARNEEAKAPVKAREAAVKAESSEPKGGGEEEKEKASEQSLEEVEEEHLRDSFWSVT